MSQCQKNKSGQCCCDCANQVELFKHPGNVINKGNVSESTGFFACLALTDFDSDSSAILLENKHGDCEMYNPKK